MVGQLLRWAPAALVVLLGSSATAETDPCWPAVNQLAAVRAQQPQHEAALASLRRRVDELRAAPNGGGPTLSATEADLAAAERRGPQLREELARAEQGLAACRARIAAQVEDRKRRQQADEERERREAERSARLAEMKRDPASQRAALSASLCWYQNDRKESFAAIAKERKYARIGGVVDVKALHDWQDDIRRDDDGIKLITGRLRGLKARALPCDEPSVSALTECLSPVLGGVIEGVPEHCKQAPHSELVELAGAP